MHADKTAVAKIAAVLGVGRATVYRALNATATVAVGDGEAADVDAPRVEGA